jgi:hypothetical protein
MAIIQHHIMSSYIKKQPRGGEGGRPTFSIMAENHRLKKEIFGLREEAEVREGYIRLFESQLSAVLRLDDGTRLSELSLNNNNRDNDTTSSSDSHEENGRTTTSVIGSESFNNIKEEEEEDYDIHRRHLANVVSPCDDSTPGRSNINRSSFARTALTMTTSPPCRHNATIDATMATTPHPCQHDTVEVMMMTTTPPRHHDSILGVTMTMTITTPPPRQHDTLEVMMTTTHPHHHKTIGCVNSSGFPSSTSFSPSLLPPCRSKTSAMALVDENKYQYDNTDDDDKYKSSSVNKLRRSPCSLPRRKILFQTDTSAIKALPREKSIENHTSHLHDEDEDEDDDDDDNDVDHYHYQNNGVKNDDDNQENEKYLSTTYEVENEEFRDYFNSQGIYTGTVQRASKMPHGIGKMIYFNDGSIAGKYYEGDWYEGRWHGNCIILRDVDGNIYQGPVVNDEFNDKMEGENGTMNYSDGRIFHGKFHEDEAVEGIMSYPHHGEQYVGQLRNDQKHGLGTYHFSDGSKYEGEFVMDVIQGRGKMTWIDGSFYKGYWLLGEIHPDTESDEALAIKCLC